MSITVLVKETFRPYDAAAFARWCEGERPSVQHPHRMAFNYRPGRPRNQYVETDAALHFIQLGFDCWTYYVLFRQTKPSHVHHRNREEILTNFTPAERQRLTSLPAFHGVVKLRNPDVLAFDPIRRQWFAYEVKRPGEKIRDGQLEGLAVLHHYFGMEVGIIRFRKKVAAVPVVHSVSLRPR